MDWDNVLVQQSRAAAARGWWDVSLELSRAAAESSWWDVAFVGIAISSGVLFAFALSRAAASCSW